MVKMLRGQIALLAIFILSEKGSSLKCAVTSLTSNPQETLCSSTTTTCLHMDVVISLGGGTQYRTFDSCSTKTQCDEMKCKEYAKDQSAKIFPGVVIENCTFSCCSTDNCNSVSMESTTPISESTPGTVVVVSDVTDETKTKPVVENANPTTSDGVEELTTPDGVEELTAPDDGEELNTSNGGEELTTSDEGEELTTSDGREELTTSGSGSMFKSPSLFYPLYSILLLLVL
ncbi:uncharacterized protein LOC120343451 [Styela clava]